MSDLITIIINVYNGEKYLKKCLDSIINQTYKNLEILIINDGSTDRTLEICKSYKDERIKIITTKNQGLSLSRNTGIDNAKGKYLYFIDADDFIELDTIEFLFNLNQKYNCTISTCKAMDIYDYNFKKEKRTEKVDIVTSKDFLKDVLLCKNKAVCTWNKLMKKELFDNLRFEDRIINDMAFTYKLIMKTDKIVCSNQIKYYYLKHSESICGKKASVERLIDIYDVDVERYNYVKKVYPNLIENKTSLLQTIIKSYLKNEEKLETYLNKQEAIKLYKQVFSLDILKCNIGIREKIKIILFRINPKLNRFIINIYLKIRKRNKNDISNNKCI